jgi:hypothetical protein
MENFSFPPFDNNYGVLTGVSQALTGCDKLGKIISRLVKGFLCPFMNIHARIAGLVSTFSAR